MTGRMIGAAVVAGALAASGSFVAPVAGQGQNGEGAAAVARMPDGKPDLHGVWSYGTITPLERPNALGEKPVFESEEEAEAFEAAERARRNQDQRDEDKARDVSRAYNDFWWDFGTDVAGRQTSLVTDPADGRIPALTPEAAQRQAERTAARATRGTADNPEDRGLWERCITRTIPTLPGPYNNNLQIVQTADHVVILNEMIHEARIVPLDNRPRLPVAQWHGQSRGRWEGNTLVVETKGLSDKTNFRGSGANLQLTERYTRTSPDILLYQVTIEDPATWTRPWTVTIPMRHNPEQIYEYACHEANYGLQGIMKGARAEDQRKPR